MTGEKQRAAMALTREANRVRRRSELEDAPMRRRAGTSETPAAGEGDREELAALLARQNELLWDILCAVNGLTATCLARGPSNGA